MRDAKRRHIYSLTRALDAVAQYRDGLVSHNMRIGPRRTSFRFDEPTWRALCDMAQRERVTMHSLFTMIDLKKPPALSLTVAIRIAVLQYYRALGQERRLKRRRGRQPAPTVSMH